jgi:hypothetical protein
MASEETLAKPKAWLRRLLKGLLYVSLSLVALFFVARLIWRFSGSNQWEFHGEKNGVKVYTLKEPGSDVRQVKGITRVHSTLAALVMLMKDPDICPEIGCKAAYTLERDGEQLQYDYFQMDLPPFRPRDVLVQTYFHQNPKTKEVFFEVSAAPAKVPLNPCCFRVTDMNNTLRFTPLGNGEVEIEYLLKENEGGFVPDLYLNMVRPQIMYYGLPELQKFVNRKKYQDARFESIEEKTGPETASQRGGDYRR